MKNKILSLMLAGAVLASAASCSSSKSSSNSLNKDVIQPTSDPQGRTAVTVGMPCYNALLCPLLDKFNTSQSEYIFQTVDYSKVTGRSPEEYNADECLEEFKQMKADLLGGSAPDMISVNPSMMIEFVRTGCFKDMYSLMDGGAGLDRSAFFPSYLESFEVDGEIPAIAPNIELKTVVAKSRFAGKGAENWSIDQFIDIAGSLPEKMELLNVSGDDRPTVFSFVSQKLRSDLLDLWDYSCNYEADSLQKAFNFAMDFPKEGENYSTQTEDGFSTEYKDDKVLLKCIQISGLGQNEGTNIWSLFGGEPVTFVGYPSADGNGTSVLPSMWLFGISSASENKENAWSALCSLMTNEEYLLNSSGISPARSFLDKCYNDKEGKMSGKYYSSIYNTALYEKDSSSGQLAPQNIPQEAVDQIYDFICNARFDPYFSFELNSIFNEEANYVLGDERSAKQACSIIQDRVGTYLAERK